MASYDPQRNRPRARPAADTPAAVDALLDHDHDHHHHGHSHDHGPEHTGPRPAGVFGAIGAAVLALVTVRLLRRRRRRRAT